MSVLEIRDLHVTVGEGDDAKEILRGVDLTVRSGETHAIMGPNGSGKSTLAYSIAGHPKYTITRGSVTLDGEDVLAMRVDDRARAGQDLPGAQPAQRHPSFSCSRAAWSVLRKWFVARATRKLSDSRAT